MKLAYRHGSVFFVSAAILFGLASCDGSSQSATADGGGGSTSTGTNATGSGGDGGLFQTNSGGSTSTGTTSMTTTPTPTEDPNGLCESASPTAVSPTWAKKVGEADVQNGLGVASDPQGNVLVAGNFLTSIDFGTGVLTSAGKNDAYLAKLGPTGAAIWAKKYGDAGYDQYCEHVASDAQSNVYVTGHFRGTINFGGGNLTDVYNFFDDIFIAKLDPSGNYLWSKRYGDINSEESQSIALDPQGNVLVVGAFQKSVNFGGGAITAEDGGFNGFVAKLNALGDQQWAKSLGDTANEQKTLGVASDGTGNVYIVGYHQGGIDLGTPMMAAAGKQNAFIAKLSPAGAFLWGKSWAADAALAVDVAVDPGGNVFVTGNFKGKMNIEGKDWDAGVANDVFLVKLDKDGTHLWTKKYGVPAAADEVSSLELQGDKPVLFGAFTKEIDFGGGALTSQDQYDVFYAKLDKDGCEIQATTFGGPTLQRGETVAIDPMGNILLAGSFTSAVDFGTGPLTANGTDVYIVKLAP